MEPAPSKASAVPTSSPEIPGHDRVAAHHDLAHRRAVGRYVVHLRVDHPDRVGRDHGAPLPGLQARAFLRGALPPDRLRLVDRVGAVGLGETVDVDDTGTQVRHSRDDRGAGWRAGYRDHELAVEAVRVRRVGDRGEHRRCAVEVGDPSSLSSRQITSARTSRRQTWVPATAASAQPVHQPLQWNIGSVHR